MFEFIKGELYSKSADSVVINVGGVGFKIYTSYQTINALGEVKKQVTVYTHLNVREDEITLFGFATNEELAVFHMLLSVSGVGPKVALSVLSTLTPSAFSMAVATGDFKVISKSKGIGPKIAQRIVLELKDKIKKNMNITDTEVSDDVSGLNVQNDVDRDAVSALMVLGYTVKEASEAVRKAYSDGMTLEETVKQALRQMR